MTPNESRQARRARLRESCYLVTAPRKDTRRVRRAIARAMAVRIERPKCARAECGERSAYPGPVCEVHR